MQRMVGERPREGPVPSGREVWTVDPALGLPLKDAKLAGVKSGVIDILSCALEQALLTPCGLELWGWAG